MGTYLLKLGPTNLWSDADPVDQQLADSFPALSTRVRLQDTARLLADGLIPSLANRLDRALRFVNIGGGPAADSFNALIILRKERPELLERRSITIAVFDLDDRGPAFGARAIEALRRTDGPLDGLRISFSHIPYDWSRVQRLAAALTGDSVIGNEMTAVSSEGGLFEYGTDEQIVANLDVLDLCTVHDAIVVGSVTRPSTAAEVLRAAGHHPLRPRTIESFATVAGEAGWRVDRVIARPLAYHVRMVKA